MKKHARLDKYLRGIKKNREIIIEELKQKKQLEIQISQIIQEINKIEDEFDLDVFDFPRDIATRFNAKQREIERLKKRIQKIDIILWGSQDGKKIGVILRHDKMIEDYKKECIGSFELFKFFQNKSSDKYLNNLENLIKSKYLQIDESIKKDEQLKSIDHNQLMELVLSVQGSMVDRSEEIFLEGNEEIVLNDEINKVLNLNLQDPLSIEQKSNSENIPENSYSLMGENPRPTIKELLLKYSEKNPATLETHPNLTELARELYRYANEKGWKYRLESIRTTLVTIRSGNK